MGATLTVNETSTQMVRLVGGKLVQEAAQRNIYVVPPKGEYAFEITGYALPFDMPKAEQYGGGMQTMTRLEFTITEGKGIGKMWTELLGFSIGEKSNLGKLLRKLNVDLNPNERGEWDLDRAVGYRGKGYVVPSDKLDDMGKPKYARLSIDTVEPLGAPEQPYSIQIMEREPVEASVEKGFVGMRVAANGNGNGNGNHAASDDGWE